MASAKSVVACGMFHSSAKRCCALFASRIGDVDAVCAALVVERHRVEHSDESRTEHRDFMAFHFLIIPCGETTFNYTLRRNDGRSVNSVFNYTLRRNYDRYVNSVRFSNPPAPLLQATIWI